MTKPTVTCPGCKKHPATGDSPYWPFCSERCKKLDLGDWAAEKFKIEVNKTAQESFEDLIPTDDSSEDSE